MTNILRAGSSFQRKVSSPSNGSNSRGKTRPPGDTHSALICFSVCPFVQHIVCLLSPFVQRSSHCIPQIFTHIIPTWSEWVEACFISNAKLDSEHFKAVDNHKCDTRSNSVLHYYELTLFFRRVAPNEATLKCKKGGFIFNLNWTRFICKVHSMWKYCSLLQFTVPILFASRDNLISNIFWALA